MSLIWSLWTGYLIVMTTGSFIRIMRLGVGSGEFDLPLTALYFMVMVGFIVWGISRAVKAAVRE